MKEKNTWAKNKKYKSYDEKTKLKISGSAKKSIKNIEIAKAQGKNSVVIEKKNWKVYK